MAYTPGGTLGGGKVDGKNLITRGMKEALKAGMKCVSGYFFSQSGRELDRNWSDIYPKLRSAREEAIAGWQCVLDAWAHRRRKSVEEKEILYGARGESPSPRTLTGRLQQGSPPRAYACQQNPCFLA